MKHRSVAEIIRDQQFEELQTKLKKGIPFDLEADAFLDYKFQFNEDGNITSIYYIPEDELVVEAKWFNKTKIAYVRFGNRANNIIEIIYNERSYVIDKHLLPLRVLYKAIYDACAIANEYAAEYLPHNFDDYSLVPYFYNEFYINPYMTYTNREIKIEYDEKGKPAYYHEEYINDENAFIDINRTYDDKNRLVLLEARNGNGDIKNIKIDYNEFNLPSYIGNNDSNYEFTYTFTDSNKVKSVCIQSNDDLPANAELYFLRDYQGRIIQVMEKAGINDEQRMVETEKICYDKHGSIIYLFNPYEIHFAYLYAQDLLPHPFNKNNDKECIYNREEEYFSLTSLEHFI